ncbi:MAG TPA: hypothetical protein VH297_04500 [Gaiellaceae bacterium]
MTEVTTAASPRGFGRTARADAWWLSPLLIVVGLTAFTVYAVFAVVQGDNYLYTGHGAHYLSPFYSPDLKSGLGFNPPFSYAFFVVWAPLGLRATCYYYRKAYYRSFFLLPPACAVSGPARRRYRGEAAFPYILQNVHRYFLYLAIVVLGFLWYDAVRAFFFKGADGSLSFGIGLGSLLMLANVLLLTGFTFGCNSLRHLIGGKLDCFTCSLRARSRHRLWKGVTVLNLKHLQWAWFSLLSVGLVDLYIRLASAGVFHDPKLL